ncbi:heavy metal-associated isoprenylated plant protein 33-like [Primulina huaijiensis]|uniref:heavy metal-associated isoprenylated plant protein 33-like n=1 Tax=Primulina huaijiensis TaxID=1492673 RepID=UPI003CC71E80
MTKLCGRFHDDSAFMTCILRVNVQTPGWQKAVRRVLSSSKGVRSFKMDEYGTVEVSGIVDPKSLLKKLGKAGNRAQLRWFQYGQCSDNLFLPYQNSGCCCGHGGDERYYPFHGGGYGGSHHCSLPTLCEYDHCTSYVTAPSYSYGENVQCCCLM